MSNIQGFIVRPGGDGERIIRRARLRNIFQPSHVFGSLILVAGLICVVFGTSIIDSVRTAQVVSYAEAETGIPLSVEEKSFGYSEVRIKLTSDEPCVETVNLSEGDTSLRSRTKWGGEGCSVVVYEQDAVWAFVSDMQKNPLLYGLIPRGAISAVSLLIGIIVIAFRRPFDPSLVVSGHEDEISDYGILSDYVIDDSVSDQDMWDAVVKEREAKELMAFSNTVKRASYAVAATKKQKKDGESARVESERLRSEVAQMLSGESTSV